MFDKFDTHTTCSKLITATWNLRCGITKRVNLQTSFQDLKIEEWPILCSWHLYHTTFAFCFGPLWHWPEQANNMVYFHTDNLFTLHSWQSNRILVCLVLSTLNGKKTFLQVFCFPFGDMEMANVILIVQSSLVVQVILLQKLTIFLSLLY